jgi:hypothetical protein
MKKSLVAISMLVLALFAGPVSAGGFPKPLIEVIDAPVAWPSGTPGSLATVQAAVLRGCADKGWIGRVVSPGLVHAVLAKSDYTAEIDIPFTVETYSIKYSASEHLDWNANKRLIHRNFNRWLVLLRQRIDLQMMGNGASH